jgi:DNA polymerase I-like protein with 3'-5' exonuclease and polymerase domains
MGFSRSPSKLPEALRPNGKAVTFPRSQHELIPGFGNIDATDMIIPRLKLLQGLSPEVKENPREFFQGEFYHSALGECMGPSLKVIPLQIRKSHELWAPRDSGEGLLASCNDGVHWDKPHTKFRVRIKGREIVWDTKGSLEESGLDQFGTSDPGNSKSPPAARLTYRIAFWLMDHPELSPVMMITSRTASVSTKEMVSRMLARHNKRIAFFTQLYDMQAVERQKASNEWYVPIWRGLGQIEDRDLIEDMEARALSMRTMNIRTDDMRPADDEGGGRALRPKAATAARPIDMHPADLAIGLVESARVLVLDVETTGVNPTDHAVGWVFASPEHSLYIPTRHTGGGNMFDDPSTFERALARAFAKRARLQLRTIGHNLPFDLWYAWRAGIDIGGPLEDTMLNAVLIDDDLRTYDLENCAERADVARKQGDALYAYLRSRFKLRIQGRKTMEHFHRLAGDDPFAVEYAKGDGVSTLELWQAQQPLLDERDLRRVHALECALLPYVARMRRRGIKVDLLYAMQAKEDIDEAIMRAEDNFKPGFRANAAADVKEWLEANGHTWFPKTKRGADSFREAWLDQSEAGQAVNQLRKLLKTLGTFIEPIIFTHNIKGRIHPDLVQFATGDYGTHTGRFSCRMPNLQAFPKRNKMVGQIVRPILIADEGMEFGEADVRQQEPRLYAHYGNDERLIEGYTSTPEVDVHTIAAEHLRLDRDRAKTLGLSIFNGMQGRSLSERMRISQNEAYNLIEDFLDVFPGIKRFRRDAVRTAESRRHWEGGAFITTLLNRRCYFHHENFYMAVSRIIQSSAADQMKLLLLRALEYEDGYPDRVNILMTIHDSVMFQSAEGADLTEFERVLNDNSTLKLKVPMPVDLATGRHWGETSYGAEAYAKVDA